MMRRAAASATGMFVAMLCSQPAIAGGSDAPAGKAPADKSPTTTDGTYVLYKLAGDNSIFTFDYGPPASPGLNLLGLSPDTTTPATTLTKFAMSLPAAFGKSANQAVALDFAPAALWERKSDTSFGRYVDSGGYFYRLQHRFRFEIALKNGNDGGSDPSKGVASGLAIGANISVLDSSDPLVTRRANDGSTYIGRCVERFTPAVMGILSANADFSTQQGEAARALSAFAHAKFELSKAAPDLAKARAYIADYLPREAPHASQRANATAAAVPAKLVILDSSITQKLGSEAATKLEADINTAIRTALASAPAGQPAAGAVTPASTDDSTSAIPDGNMDLPALTAFVDSEIKIWEDKQTALNQAGNKAVAAGLTAEIKQQFKVDGVASAFAACTTQASRIARFSTDLKIGFGSVWTGQAGELRNLGHGSQVGWVSFKLPLFVNLPDANNPNEQKLPVPTSALMVAFSGRFGHSEIVSTGDKATPMIGADTVNAWAGVEWISENWRLAGQYGWVRTWARDKSLSTFNTSGQRYLVSSQLRLGGLSSGVWLGASYGNAYGTAAALRSSTALVTLSYSPPAPPDIAQGK
jgi:hypothetical protein